jgi:hypothetical protein
MKKTTKKLLLQAFLIIALWVIGISFGFNSELELYGLLMLVTLMPIIILHAYRHKRKKEIGLLNKIFCFFTSLYIVISIIWLLSAVIGDYLFYLSWMSFGDFLYYFIPLAGMVVTLFILKKINISFMSEKEHKLIPLIKRNKEVTIAVSAIVLIFIISLFIWFTTDYKIDQEVELFLDTDLFLDDNYIQSIYNTAYKKIITFAGFIFTSAFLLLYSLKKR